MGKSDMSEREGLHSDTTCCKVHSILAMGTSPPDATWRTGQARKKADKHVGLSCAVEICFA